MDEHRQYVIDASKIVGVRVKYFIAALVDAGISVSQISECIDWANSIIELGPNVAVSEEIVELAARL